MKSFKLFSRSRKDPDGLNVRSMILPIVFCLVCGVLLILFGNLALRITAYVLAGVMLLCGIGSVILYIRSGAAQRNMYCQASLRSARCVRWLMTKKACDKEEE